MKKSILIIFGIVCGFTLVLFAIFNFALYPKKYKNYVNNYAQEFNLEPALVYAVIKTESNFKVDAKSYAGALGLMQLIPSTAKWIATELNEVFDRSMLLEPQTNVKYGCFYLRYLFDKFNNIDVVICAYNAGETAVKSWIDESGNLLPEKISYSETKNYFYKVKGYYNIYLSQNKGM